MALATLSGVVSGIRHSTETRGTVGRNGGSVKTGQVIAFRVDDRSAQIKLAEIPDIRDGDQVTLAGREKNGVLGVMTLIFLVGIIFIGVGLWTLYEAYTYTQAAKMLQGA